MRILQESKIFIMNMYPFPSSAKVRRLYDIANILSSLQLIEKVHIHSIQTGRKPGFRWTGIDPNKLEFAAYVQGALNLSLKCTG